ncbi:hypothetical protein B0J13DRAFT_521496 [Dactylonectria estremocensis]|uniref:Uncharacterized protein n=1 Tax=Dactylonectria estremocensis TaxID=1079267 RepID=A0A9P9J7K4_9HYPO|nr:hypothetical protein B0J13DRAFT_521496 [Dactylonectria estremocensis]
MATSIIRGTVISQHPQANGDAATYTNGEYLQLEDLGRLVFLLLRYKASFLELSHTRTVDNASEVEAQLAWLGEDHQDLKNASRRAGRVGGLRNRRLRAGPLQRLHRNVTYTMSSRQIKVSSLSCRLQLESPASTRSERSSFLQASNHRGFCQMSHLKGLRGSGTKVTQRKEDDNPRRRLFVNEMRGCTAWFMQLMTDAVLIDQFPRVTGWRKRRADDAGDAERGADQREAEGLTCWKPRQERTT